MKKNIIKKSMSLFLTLAMVISLIPALTLSASATGPFYTTSTNVGSLVTLTFVQLFGSEAATTYSGDYINIASYSQPTSGVNTAKLLSSDFTTELGYNDPSYGIDTEPDIYFSASTAGVYTFTAAIVDGNNTNNTLLSNTIQVTVTSPTSAPTVTTTGVTTYDATTATTGGNVTDTGTASVTDRGVVYSTTDTTPTIAEGATHDSNGTGTGVFSESVTGLSPNTKYYVCAYATNSVGTSYGTVVNFTTSAISASISPSTTLTEENLDTNSLTVALSGTTFADATLAASNFTLNNAPTGVTVESVSYTDTTHCAVNLAYTGADFDTSVTTFSLTIAAAELASNSALTSGALTITAMVEAAPTVTTVAASSISSAAATLNGTVNANNATSVVTFDYGTSTSYGSSVTAPQSPVTGASATSVSYALTGLVPNTTYHYRVNSVNTVGTSNGSDMTFTTTAIAPTAATVAASNVSSTSATLTGTVNANNATSVVTFDYGTSTSYGSSATAAQSPVTGTSATSVSADLTGLVPNTAYHYRTKSVNAAGTTYGSDLTFTTSAIAPTGTTVAASSISSSAATLNGTVNANNATSVVTFDYGTSTSYGSSATAAQSPVTGTSATSVSSALTGLVPNTTYHYRTKSVNTAGTTYGSDLTFTTSAIAPTAATVAASGVSATSATLNGTVNANNATSVVTFDYGTSMSYGSSATAVQSPVTGTSATSVSATLSGLVPNTTYHYRTKSVNTAGTTYGSDLSFTTPNTAASISPTTALTEENLIGNSLEVTLSGTTFLNSTLDASNFTLNGAPQGVTIGSISYTDATHCTVNLAYDGTDFDSSVANFSLTVKAAVLALGSDLTSGTLTITATIEVAPTVTTASVSPYTATTATMAGNVTISGGESVTDRGVVYSTTDTTPTITEGATKDSNGIGTGSFSKSISSLLPNTTYYVCAYATNSVGTAYGSVVTFTTSDTYTIGSVANQTLTALTAGYSSGTQDTKTVTITKTGTGTLSNLAVALSGTNASSFTITQPAP
jgi:phosphodiesterase/alkaline phosphatase D-like protein